MRAEDRQTGKDSRLSRLLRRALLVVGGAIAAAVITSAPAWADVLEDGVTVTATTTSAVISSVADATKTDELPGRVLDTGRGLVPAPVVPISLDTGLALLHEFATDLPLASPAELRRGDVVAPVSARPDLLLDEGRSGSPVNTPVARFSTEPVSPSVTSDVIVSEAASTLPSSNATNGQRNDTSPVVPRRGELNGTCHATRTTEAGQLACRSWTSDVRVMSVRVGKQPGRTPD